jgi:hypothetical protein
MQKNAEIPKKLLSFLEKYNILGYIEWRVLRKRESKTIKIIRPA